MPPPRRRRSAAEPRRKVVVDGSNLATEGRSEPDLSQLDDAIGAFLEEYPGFDTSDVVVIVDATFGHRIDETERPAYEDAITHGELITPPAGTIGRGDAFILRVAEKAAAVVLSNDSFQEFHAEHPWLFDEGRLIGGKPVPGVGWVFAPRLPVRGPRSRAVTTAARRRSRAAEVVTEDGEGLEEAATPAGTVEAQSPDGAAPSRSSRRRRRGRGRGGAVGPEGAVGAEAPATAVPLNEPLAFLTFVADHPVGSAVTGTVAAFTSHGAHVDVGSMRCHVPLRGLGDPPPARARDVLTKGEVRQFVLVSLDAQGRRAELSLASMEAPGHAEAVTPVSAAAEAAGGERGAAGAADSGTATAGRTAAVKAAKATKAAKETKAPRAAKAANAAKAPVTAKKAAAAVEGAVGEAPATTTKTGAGTKAGAVTKAGATKTAAAKKAAAPAKVVAAKKSPAPAKTAAAKKAITATTSEEAGLPRVAKSARPVKAAEATKATKAVKATKATRATKVAKASTSPRAAKAPGGVAGVTDAASPDPAGPTG